MPWLGPTDSAASAGASTCRRSLKAMAAGLFVMSHLGPLKWWAPKQRMVLFFDQARLEKTVRRLLKNQRFRITFDTAFDAVVRACAEPRPGRTPITWITPKIRKLFRQAHEAGHAHSVEVWLDDRRVGGVYGLAVGKTFFTESQFHTMRDASKIGFAVLNRHLQAWGFGLNDGKHQTSYLADCGFQLLTRDEFTTATAFYSAQPGLVGRWRPDPALLDGDWMPATAAGVALRDILPDGLEYDRITPEMVEARRSNTW